MNEEEEHQFLIGETVIITAPHDGLPKHAIGIVRERRNQ